MLKKFLLGQENTSVRDGIAWNTIWGIVNAGQSVILLMVITRICGLQDAGIFTIAYSIATLMLTISRYGMRSFQVTDIGEQFDFAAYYSSRIITTAAMLVASLINVIYRYFYADYSDYKCLVVLLVCVLKSLDGIEDVFSGRFQQKKRLDIGARIMAVRLIATLIVQILVLLITDDLVCSLVITIAFSLLFLCIALKTVCGESIFEIVGSMHFKLKDALSLVKICLPLFAARFLSIYISNIPKYSIDTNLDDIAQACYGFIFMPVYMINVVGQFIFQPVLVDMAQAWETNNLRKFNRIILHLIMLVVGCTIVGMLAFYLCGVQILSIIYHTDLSAYRTEIVVFMLAGGFLAVITIWNLCLTVVRKQQILVWGYGIVIIVEKMLADTLITRYQIRGATVLYLGSVIFLCIALGNAMLYILHRKKQALLHYH